MVAEMNVRLGCALVFITVSTLISATEYVPVLLWKSNGDISLPSASAGDHLSVRQFRDDIVNKLGNNNGPIFVFMQESLSLEDFTLYGNAYGSKSSISTFSNLQKIVDNYDSILLPSVELPNEGISQFNKNNRRIVANASDTDFTANNVNAVFLFDLSGTESVADREKALEKNDQIIGRVMKRAKDLYPSFTALYTGKKSSWVIPNDNDVPVTHLKRHILSMPTMEATNYTGVFKSFGNCFLMYAKNLTFKLTSRVHSENNALSTNSTVVPLSEVEVDPSSLCAGNNSALLIFKYKNDLQSDWLQSLQFTLNFTRSRRDEWYLTTISLVYQTDNGVNVDANLRTNDAWAPIGSSWNCGTARFMDMNRTYPRAELEFNKLQFQAFDVNESFGDAFDCIGFFTIGIWMSIFSSIILIAILACGISMVMGIHTMDRFDDPKGKTITVSATD